MCLHSFFVHLDLGELPPRIARAIHYALRSQNLSNAMVNLETGETEVVPFYMTGFYAESREAARCTVVSRIEIAFAAYGLVFDPAEAEFDYIPSLQGDWKWGDLPADYVELGPEIRALRDCVFRN